MKTFIKWFCNKSRYKQKIISHFPIDFDTYIEPFIGSGAMFLEVQPKKWIINDINKDLIYVWKSVLKSVNTMVKIIGLFSNSFLSLDKPKQLVLCRSITNKLSTMRYGPTRSAYFILMKYCVYLGSLLKNNKYYFRGLEANFMNIKYVPFFSKPGYIDNLKQVNKFMSSTSGSILNKDYTDVLKLVKQGDFVFMDPPYIEDHEYDFAYNVDEKSNETFIATLLKECKKLDKKKIKWLMTQAYTPCIRKMFAKYSITEMKVYRAPRKAYTTELIIKNY